jgi:hypothetical protein
MYQLTDSNLSAIEAWFLQDVPCKGGISIIEFIKTLSAENKEVSEEVPEQVVTKAKPKSSK